MRKHRRGGFIVIQNSLALIIILSFIPLVYATFRITINHDFLSEVAQDEIAIHQLRRTLILSENIGVTQDILSFLFNNEFNEMVIKNGHSYIQPGTQLVFNNIDDGYFSQEGNLIWINYLRNDKWYKRVLINV